MAIFGDFFGAEIPIFWGANGGRVPKGNDAGFQSIGL